MGQCACKEATIEVDKDLVVDAAQPSGASSSSETDVDKAPGCYHHTSASSGAEDAIPSSSSSSLSTRLDLAGGPAADLARRNALLLRGGASSASAAVQRRSTGGPRTPSGGVARRKDSSLSTVDSFDGNSSEISVSFSTAASEAPPRFADAAAAALLEASARRLASSSTPAPVADGSTEVIVERLRNLERRIPATRRTSSGRHGVGDLPLSRQARRP